MTRVQIQLPDDLFQRAKTLAAERELSMAEIIRRGLELFLERYPQTPPEPKKWQLPKVDGGKIRMPLEQLKGVGRITAGRG